MVSNQKILELLKATLSKQNSRKLALFVVNSSLLNCNTRFPKPGVAGSNPAEAARKLETTL